MAGPVMWCDGLLLAFDVEATGVDPASDYLVTAAALLIWRGTVEQQSWVADPGIEIPTEAAQIHGFTTERARHQGQPEAHVVREVAGCLRRCWSAECPLVAFNAAYDLTLLHHRLIAHGEPGLVPLPGPVVDPLVLDRAMVKRRYGKRTLPLLAGHYGLSFDPEVAHESGYDALIAARLAYTIAKRHPEQVGNRPPWELHAAQAAWHAEWAEGFEDWLRGRKRADGEPEEDVAAVVIDREWPLLATAVTT
jgi:DNA polymerase III subunit epsilon